MNPAVTNLIISLGAMQLAKRVPFDDPEVLTYVRIAYVVTQVTVLAVYYYVGQQIKKKNDLTVLKYVEPNAMDKDNSKLITTTVRDYDLAETSKLVRAVYFGCAMMAFMHIYLKYTQPLFIQALMGLKTLYDAKLVRIHLLGKPAEGDLKRPFKVGGMFGAASDPQTDKAAVAEAEKRVGKKEE
ncbi:inorganic phosphate transporter [Lentinus brumalis]|uniref:Inorganic phosphate transporter n=1 Tax=Lentinus brumalis TaxID=2498619 RepID=A0A371CNG9_9APHY|nr:inorganic phosphate transporter [Polyporus brumalis]